MNARQADLGDFKEWLLIDYAEDANKWLAELRHLAQVHPSDVTVEVVDSSDPKVRDSLVAVKTGIRLSQTEFVPFEPSFHTYPADYTWKVDPTHDGAILLTSKINGFNVTDQVFTISFTDQDDLTRRIVHLIQSRLHRIRYVWPYENEIPTVIRDVDFALDKGSKLEAREIRWLNPLKDQFEEGSAPFPIYIIDSDSHRFRIDGSQFPRKDKTFDFDPMSNISYQVLLIRPNEERLVFQILSYAFVALLGLAALAAIYDFRRQLRVTPPVAYVGGDLQQNYRQTLENCYQSWRATGKQPIADANVIWCNRGFLEQFIEELKSSLNPSFDRRRFVLDRLGFFAKIPLVKDFLGVTFDHTVDYTWIYEPSKVDDPKRLSGLVPFLIERRLLSPFVGTQLEWDVLNTIASNVFKRFQAITPAPVNGSNKIISRDNPTLESLVSKHFYEVVNDSMSKASFFNQSWDVIEQNDGQRIFVHKESITYRNGSEDSSASQMVMSFKLPKDAYLNGDISNGKLNAWLLGKIQKKDSGMEDGLGCLRIEFKPLALLKD